MQLGFGINSYVDTLKSLVFFFLTVSIACIPIFYSYGSDKFGALKTTELNPFARMGVMTLGNLGGASVLCIQKRVIERELSLQCPRGSVLDFDSIKYGFMDSYFQKTSYCTEAAIWEQEDPK